MKGLIVIVILVAAGLGAGIGAGLVLAPPPEPPDAVCDTAIDADCKSEGDPPPETAENAADPSDDEDAPYDYVKLNNQFVIPIVREERVSALVVISVTLEVETGTSASVFDREPKIRDAFLQEMFDFAYLGGFDGPFTKSENLSSLRRALKEIGQRIAGPIVHDVLIVDLVRQEV